MKKLTKNTVCEVLQYNSLSLPVYLKLSSNNNFDMENSYKSVIYKRLQEVA